MPVVGGCGHHFAGTSRAKCRGRYTDPCGLRKGSTGSEDGRTTLRAADKGHAPLESSNRAVESIFDAAESLFWGHESQSRAVLSRCCAVESHSCMSNRDIGWSNLDLVSSSLDRARTRLWCLKPSGSRRDAAARVAYRPFQP